MEGAAKRANRGGNHDHHHRYSAEVQAAARGSVLETYAAALPEEALQGSGGEPVPRPATRRTGQALIDAFAEIRGLLTDEEIDRMIRRSPSTARPVDLS